MWLKRGTESLATLAMPEKQRNFTFSILSSEFPQFLQFLFLIFSFQSFLWNVNEFGNGRHCVLITGQYIYI